MLILIKNCELVFTDSGGLQKESCFLGKRCITIFNHTPWKELEKDNWIFICDTLTNKNVNRILEKIELIKKASDPQRHFGNGQAIKKIAEILKKGV